MCEKLAARGWVNFFLFLLKNEKVTEKLKKRKYLRYMTKNMFNRIYFWNLLTHCFAFFMLIFSDWMFFFFTGVERSH